MDQDSDLNSAISSKKVFPMAFGLARALNGATNSVESISRFPFAHNVMQVGPYGV